MSDEKIISLRARATGSGTRRQSKPTDLATKKIRDIAVKAVIYPQAITAREVQDLGASVLYHLKMFYPALDE